ncbi:hypothetical protein QJQ45_028464, partial [Haematococcus lacustris]
MAHTALPLVHADGVISIATGDKRVPLLSQIHSSVRQLPDVSERLGGAKAGILQEAVAAGSAQGSWGLVLGLEAPGGSPSSILDVCIAKLAPGRMLACARSKLWWMTPEWRSSTRSLPPEIQFLLVEVQPGGQGPYALLLPLIDGDFRATLRPADPRSGNEGDLVLRVESGDARVQAAAWGALLHVSAGSDPFSLVERGVAIAAHLSGTALPLSIKELPPSLDVFGWCTWDAFYSTVSAKGIQEGLSSLVSGGITPRTLIIDDGWQMTDVDPPSDQAPAVTPSDLAQRLTWLPEEERQLLADTQDEFIRESREVLADTAARLSPGTSAGTSMPSLAGLGSAALHPPSASHPAAPSPAAHPNPAAGAAQPSSPAGAAAGSGQQQGHGQGLEQSGAASQAAVAGAEVGGAAGGKAEALLFARLGQKVAGWLVGLGTAAFLIAYQWVVEPSAGGSAAVRGFAALAQGVLRPAMLGFYAGASDFTRRLISVRANAKFSSPDAGPDQPWAGVPEQLGKVVQAIKANWGVQYVYCWHGLPAYWAGVMPDAPEVAKFGAHILYAQPTPGVLEIEPSMAWNPAVLAGVGVLADPTAVYTEMHAYLRDAGVDGVKVDCQAGVGLVGSALGGGPALSRTFQAALERSISNYFPSNHAINCMCHSTENLYRMEATAVVRASDDFYPRDPASSHPHIAACAYNSVFLAALLQPDWDMFHSKHPAAYLHAMA